MGWTEPAKKIWNIAKDVGSLNDRVNNLEEENAELKTKVHKLELENAAMNAAVNILAATLGIKLTQKKKAKRRKKK